LLGDDGAVQVADCHFSCGSYRKHHVSSPYMLRLRNIPTLTPLPIRSLQVLMLSSRWSHVRMHRTLCWVTQDMFRSSDRMLWQVPWLIPAAAAMMSPSVWKWLTCTDAAASWILSSVLTVLSGPVCSSSKLSLPCAKCLCHLYTVLWPKASLLYAWSSETFRYWVSLIFGRTWSFPIAQTAAF
jgi:hypothetical protein